MPEGGHIVRVPMVPEYSWPSAMVVAREAADRGLVLMRIWEAEDYCVVGGPRTELLARGSLRVCREWIAGYLGQKGEFVSRPLPALDARGDGPPY